MHIEIEVEIGRVGFGVTFPQTSFSPKAERSQACRRFPWNNWKSEFTFPSKIGCMYLQNVGDVIPGGDDDGTGAMGIYDIVRPDLRLLTANLCHSRGTTRTL